ncbi:MAG TPA: DUF4446 family protein [Jatrophihabitans sp.]|nr:DUF4446 family protein [Jatrophihabitans sp.]
MSETLSAIALVLGLIGLVTGTLALRTLARLRRSVALLSRGSSGRETILEVAEKHMAASVAVRQDILELQRDLTTAHESMRTQLAAERAELSTAVQGINETVNSVLRRVALVRYDAFDDLSGRLSFSLAIMDDRGNGIALTSIAGTSETRLYAKSITGGVAEHQLSPEEEHAVRAAMAG